MVIQADKELWNILLDGLHSRQTKAPYLWKVGGQFEFRVGELTIKAPNFSKAS